MDFIDQLKQALAKKSPLYIRVKAVPKSPKNEIVELMADETYKIRVAAPAEGGKANSELTRFLKKSLGASAVEIVSGKTDRIKLIRLCR
jgi:uncharacterized protein (TIGR00251 family)